MPSDSDMVKRELVMQQRRTERSSLPREWRSIVTDIQAAECRAFANQILLPQCLVDRIGRSLSCDRERGHEGPHVDYASGVYGATHGFPVMWIWWDGEYDTKRER